MTTGLVSCTDSEVSVFQALYSARNSHLSDSVLADAAQATAKYVSEATSALSIQPQSFNLTTSGDEVEGGGTANTAQVSSVAEGLFKLAFNARITGNATSQAHAFAIIGALAQSPIVSDAPAYTPLFPAFQAIDLLGASMPPALTANVSAWMQGIGNALIAADTAAQASGSVTAINNYKSTTNLLLNTFGNILGNNSYINYATNNQTGFPKQIGVNIAPYAPYSLDKVYRNSSHYDVLDKYPQYAQAVQMQRMGPAYNNPMTLMVNGSSLSATTGVVVSYVDGTLPGNVPQYMAGVDQNTNDQQRLMQGLLSPQFYRNDSYTTSCLEQLVYFNQTINDASGQPVNLPQAIYNNTISVGKVPLSPANPTIGTLLSNVKAGRFNGVFQYVSSGIPSSSSAASSSSSVSSSPVSSSISSSLTSSSVSSSAFSSSLELSLSHSSSVLPPELSSSEVTAVMTSLSSFFPSISGSSNPSGESSPITSASTLVTASVLPTSSNYYSSLSASGFGSSSGLQITNGGHSNGANTNLIAGLAAGSFIALCAALIYIDHRFNQGRIRKTLIGSWAQFVKPEDRTAPMRDVVVEMHQNRDITR